MKRVVVFVGPSLAIERAKATLRAEYRGPAAQGDVYRAALTKPFAIGIIDGYFERVPAVWHKEILWAISRGIHVYGAASMGALRASELDRFGMVGVGSIYRSFASGELEDDDEVAILHSDIDHGYRALSEAMVNIRPTLEEARACDVLSKATAQQLERIAKAMPYFDRSYPSLCSRARTDGLPIDELDALLRFVREGKVDQKARDAEALLEVLSRLATRGEPPPPPIFSFAHTEAWEQVVSRVGAAS